MFSETKKEIKDNFLKEAKRSAKGTKTSEKKKKRKEGKAKSNEIITANQDKEGYVDIILVLLS